MRQLIDIQTAGSNVSGDQNTDGVRLEVRQSLGPSVLAFVAVNRDGWQAVLVEVLSETVGTVLGAGEDQHLLPSPLSDQMGE